MKLPLIVRLVVGASVIVAPATVVNALKVVAARGIADNVVIDADPSVNVPLVKLTVPLLSKLPFTVPNETPDTEALELTTMSLKVEGPAPDTTVVPSKLTRPDPAASVPVNVRFPRIVQSALGVVLPPAPIITLVKSFVPKPDKVIVVNVIVADDAGESVVISPLPTNVLPLKAMLVL